MHWAWLFLLAAILMEVTGTTFMKLSDGFRHGWFSAAVFVFYGLSLAAFVVALRRIDLSVAYAIWSGLGVALVATVGIAYFEEPLTGQKLACLLLIVIGVVGLQMQSG